MITSISAMVIVFAKTMSGDKGTPAAHAEALVKMAGMHAKQTGDSEGFTANQDRRRARRTGVRCSMFPLVV